ncbi:hemicentin-2 isoform X1 [Cimex lectularius]|uniref:Ig-like domain-containing protein n=1 Tax=Cimex lectularius TaxID=79782 RepID=A0A8I6SNX6_CIMLE|nr:hemicentin-2 isoform X1 [Cimex lectularius]
MPQQCRAIMGSVEMIAKQHLLLIVIFNAASGAITQGLIVSNTSAPKSAAWTKGNAAMPPFDQDLPLVSKGGGLQDLPTSHSYWEQPFTQPYFDNSTKREVTTTVGQSAYLHCRVRNLGDRAVSWIRKRDLHILTAALLTYTNDQRFQSLHSDGSDEWTLKIASPQLRDSGIYECQVSTEPKISQAFRLNVVVSQAEILGKSEIYIKSGSDINLTCVVRETPEPPSFIYWYRGNNVINYSQRGGISVLTEKQTRTSRLLIARALPADSGNYTCAPSSSHAASVLVHVLNGEHPAAMQHGNSSSSRGCGLSLLHPLFLAISIQLRFR